MRDELVITGREWSAGRPVRVLLHAGRIARLEPADDSADLSWIVPTLFDVQINGGMGVNFTSKELTEECIGRVVEALAARGVGGFAATVITADADTILASMRALAGAGAYRRMIPAIHLEGPYICGEDGPRGAHDRKHVRDPDWSEFQRFQEAAGGLIRMVTLAPERPGALVFIERLRSAGIVPAIGHTAASSVQIRDAVAAGAMISTHLGNGCHASLPRHDNYFWEQLGCDELWASIIPDGHHLPPAILKTILRTKTPARLVVTSDLSALAGQPPGRYTVWGREVEVRPGGRICLPGENRLAGSGVFPDDCAAHLLREAGVGAADLAAMCCVNPRKLLGIAPPVLEVGAAWDFLCVRGGVLERNR